MPVNPKSLKNLRPRKSDYEEPKKDKTISITEFSWRNLEQLSQDLGYRSRSAFFEAIARGELKVSPKNKDGAA